MTFSVAPKAQGAFASYGKGHLQEGQEASRITLVRGGILRLKRSRLFKGGLLILRVVLGFNPPHCTGTGPHDDALGGYFATFQTLNTV